MEANDIRVFIPSKSYEESQLFYQAIGFKMSYVSEDLSAFENRKCTFFLQRFYNEDFANNLMFQLSVESIQDAFNLISSVKGIKIKFGSINKEPWGSVFYLWGPSGELWHITEFDN